MTEPKKDESCACYMFEAKSIQQYLFSTNRLREIVGGSEMIENITGEGGLLDNLIKELGLKGKKLKFSRKGGGGFYVFSDLNTIEQLKNAWSLLFQVAIPNMTFNHASAQANSNLEAFESAQVKLLASGNRIMAKMPQATPYTLRFNRTGEPAEKSDKEKTEAVDIATHTKLKYAKKESLIKRFDKHSERRSWPVYLTPEPNKEKESFPFNDDSQAIALIHADGNGFGQLLMTLKSLAKDNPKIDFIQLFSDVSQAISSATENAAQIAVDTVLAPHKRDKKLYPARPIVLGGDDLTIIVRADLAIAFTQVFLNAFESESKIQLKALKDNHPLLTGIPSKLTACAGITFAKASHPFHMMHDLSEALCSAAKLKSKSNLLNDIDDGKNKIVPSSLVFHRITTSLVDDYPSIVDNELTVGGQVLTLGAYVTNPEDESALPCLDDLFKLLACFKNKENSSNALREIQSLLKNDKEEAETRYKRWLEVIEKDQTNFKQDYLDVMDCLIETSESNTTHSAEGFDSIKAWPLNDLLSLKAVNAKPLHSQDQSEEK